VGPPRLIIVHLMSWKLLYWTIWCILNNVTISISLPKTKHWLPIVLSLKLQGLLFRALYICQDVYIWLELGLFCIVSLSNSAIVYMSWAGKYLICTCTSKSIHVVVFIDFSPVFVSNVIGCHLWTTCYLSIHFYTFFTIRKSIHTQNNKNL